MWALAVRTDAANYERAVARLGVFHFIAGDVYTEHLLRKMRRELKRSREKEKEDGAVLDREVELATPTALVSMKHARVTAVGTALSIRHNPNKPESQFQRILLIRN